MYNMVSALSESSPYGYGGSKQGSDSKYERNNNYYNRNRVYDDDDDENPYYCRSVYTSNKNNSYWD